jgi:hypothetical protein
MRSWREGPGRPVHMAVALALLVIAALTSCSEEAPPDELETSDQLISTSPTTVAPTPANASPEEGSLIAWCRKLEEASENRVQEIYREGMDLDNPTVARAAAMVVSGEGSEEKLTEAGDRIEQACSEVTGGG